MHRGVGREEAASAFNRAGGAANYNAVLQPVRGARGSLAKL